MSARQITDQIVSLAEAYRKLGESNCETPSEYARRCLTERKAGQSRSSQLSPDVIEFIGVILDGFMRHYEVSVGLFEGYCAGMKRNHEDKMGMAFMAYLCIFRYNPVDFGADTIGPLIFHVSARTRIVEFILFMCDGAMVLTHAGPVWCRHVQDAYVEDFLVPTCTRNAEVLKMAILTPSERGELFVGTATANGGARSKTSRPPTVGGDGGLLAELEGGGASATDDEEGNDEEGADEDAPLTNNNNNTSANVVKGKAGTSSSSSLLAKQKGKGVSSPTTATASNSANKGASPRPPRNPPLPPACVREMEFTIPEKRPKAVLTKPTEAELRVVEAAKFGAKLSALDDATKAENRAREEAIPFKPFTGHNRPSNMDRLLEEKRAREREEMAALPPRPTVEEVRRNLNDIGDKVEVKTTKAALKRELALVQRRKEEEEQRFAQRLAALRDDTEFRDWQSQGRKADDDERLRQMQQRRLEAMLTDEEARQARAKQTRAKQAESRAMKDELEEKRERLRRENEARQYELAKLAEEQRQQMAADVADAVEAVQKSKRNAMEEVKTQRQKNEVEMALQAELERRRKAEIIASIKQMQKESAELRKEAVLAKQLANKVSSHSAAAAEDALSLLHVPTEEMSIADLKKLLNATQREQDRLVEEKRVRIVADREAEKASLQSIEALVMRHRDQLRTEKETKREDKRAQLSLAAAAAKAKEEQQILELQAKLAKRRDERKQNEAAVKDDERRRMVAAQLLMKDTKAVEKKKLEQMEKAAENTVVAAQNARLKERKVQRGISANESAKRETNLNSAQRRLQAARAHSDQINEEKKAAVRQEVLHDTVVRNALFAELGMGGGGAGASARR